MTSVLRSRIGLAGLILLAAIILAAPSVVEARARPFGGRITSTVDLSSRRQQCPLGFVVSGVAAGITIFQSGSIFGGNLGVGKWVLGLAKSGGPCGLWSIIRAGVSR